MSHTNKTITQQQQQQQQQKMIFPRLANINKSRALFVASGATTLIGSTILFRDLADLSQWVLDVDRNQVLQTFHQRHAIATISLSSMAVNTYATFGMKATARAGVPIGAWAALNGVSLLMFYSGYINPSIMMRPRNENPLYVPSKDILKHLKKEETVIVTQIGNNQPQAFPDSQVLRPHVARVGATETGNPVVMTYCGLTNLGIAYETPNNPDGSQVELVPLTQLENNLVLADKATGHVGHQINGISETALAEKIGGNYSDTSRRPCNLKDSNLHESYIGKEVPTWRMSLGNFVRTYPNGQVFVNDYKELKNWRGNPIMSIYDALMDTIFDTSIKYQATNPKPVFPTLQGEPDTRLAPKEKVWAFNDADDYVALTENFVRDAPSGVRNMTVGSIPIVAAWDDDAASLGIWRRPSNAPINGPVNIHGQVNGNQQPLKRIATVKNGAYWCVWSNFFPQTRVNPGK